jgi:acetoacetyl-CoA synthetase
MASTPPILWEATDQQKRSSHIYQFMEWLKNKKQLQFDDYAQLYQWSISQAADFWRCFVEYAKIFSFPDDQDVCSKWKNDFIGVKWFEGVEVNYAQAIFKQYSDVRPAVLFAGEHNIELQSVSWKDLYQQVSALAHWMRTNGIQKGDRVVSILPNIPENVTAFLATQSIGAVWSSCSPDFGNDAIWNRFDQIEPVLLFAADQTTYNGKQHEKSGQIRFLQQSIASIRHTVLLKKSNHHSEAFHFVDWNKIIATEGGELYFEPLSFDHPLWILYSSGTTGAPKAIVHSVGGNLIEHMKVLLLHWDVHPGERFFWYSTTGWMMWNFSVASLLTGATLILYDGSPTYPTTERLWQLAADAAIHHLGLGAAYLIHCQKSNISFNRNKFPALRTIGSTGSPLTPEAYQWVYQHVKSGVWLISFSGGTDICSGFVGGNILLPVVEGEIQCRLLGCDLDAVDETGQSVRDDLGEMIIRQPMPSMPVCFWGDMGDAKYRSSYFEKFPCVWWHGDFITLTSRDTVVISGRSDATLNRDGVRIGTAEIYGALATLPFVNDSLVVCLEKKDGSFFMPLFIKMEGDEKLTEPHKQIIDQLLRRSCSPRHVPDAIYAVPDIPYTISGKKMEIPVKRILMGLADTITTLADSMRNPSSLNAFKKMV